MDRAPHPFPKDHPYQPILYYMEGLRRAIEKDAAVFEGNTGDLDRHVHEKESLCRGFQQEMKNLLTKGVTLAQIPLHEKKAFKKVFDTFKHLLEENFTFFEKQESTLRERLLVHHNIMKRENNRPSAFYTCRGKAFSVARPSHLFTQL